MTREEAKEMLPIIQAYAEGKTIQYRNIEGEWEDIKVPSFDGFPSDYRIKPEPKYRPFQTKEECWNEMLKHQPFGWINNKNTKDYYSIISISKIAKSTKASIDDYEYEFNEIFNCFTFADGTPFGIKEE